MDERAPNSSTCPILGQDEVFEQLFSVQALGRTWSTLRREFRFTIARDVVDWTDFVLAINRTLPEIRRTVIEGSYVPSPVTRFESGKASGSFRVITSLNVRDALVFRHISDHALSLAVPNQVPGAYFSRRHSPTPVGRLLDGNPDPSDRFFAIWLRYNQYRSRTLLNGPYEVLVVTDITNYFESVQHELLFEYLAPLGLPRKAVGLLGRLLEAFRPESGHSASPAVGLPLDELDCARELAHIFLFEHDRRIVTQYGEGAYVRWMDDQNIGARSLAEARQIVNCMTRSLSEQRLTLNAGKTQFLSPEEVVVHFHLDTNEELDSWWEQLNKAGGKTSVLRRRRLEELWFQAIGGQAAEQGNWDKVLKRFYAYATRANCGFMEERALIDLVAYPHLAERIFSYFTRRGKGRELTGLMQTYMNSGENLFEETETRFFESLLLLDADEDLESELRQFTTDFAQGALPNQTDRPLGRSSALIASYWFGADSNTIRSVFTPDNAISLPKEVARSWFAVSVATNPELMDELLGALFGHPSDDLLRLVRFLQELMSGRLNTLGNYRNLKERWPMPGRYYDARTWLILELGSHANNGVLKNRLCGDLEHFSRHVYTMQERRIYQRVRERLET